MDAAEETIGDTAAELLAVRADAAVATELLAVRNQELERERASREEAEALKVCGLMLLLMFLLLLVVVVVVGCVVFVVVGMFVGSTGS